MKNFSARAAVACDDAVGLFALPGADRVSSKDALAGVTNLPICGAPAASAEIIQNTPGDTQLGCAPNRKRAPAAAELRLQNRAGASDEQFNLAISSYQGGLDDWAVQGLSLSRLAQKFREWAPELWGLIIEHGGRGLVRQPPPTFVFDWESERRLGHYRRGRNQSGLMWEISVNPANLNSLSEVSTASIVLHEELHLLEDITNTAPESRNGYHSAWLRNTATRLGIPCTKYGCTSGIRDDSPFMRWARTRGLAGTPLLLSVKDKPNSAKPRRLPWICDCPKGMGVTVLVPIGSELRARCEICASLFHRK